jgi:SAM-dependent MidA family methyltransferase
MAYQFKISQIINQALFDPVKGYYKTKNPIGKNNDFITAPEISSIFAEVIASYLLYHFANKKNRFSLVEMGAGTSALFANILHSIKNLAQKKHQVAIDFIEFGSFHIIEINPVLKKLQQQNLENFGEQFKIKWHENFSQFLASKNGEIYFISNELFDCFAIDQYLKTQDGWQEKMVEVDDPNNLSNPRLVIANYDQKINDFVEQQIGKNLVNQASINAIFEYSQDARNFFSQLSQAIKTHQGIAINCDYGYDQYHFANSLQAIKNHQKLDFIDSFYEADITAHVDFFALDNIAKNFKLETSLISQRQFLLELGAEDRKNQLCLLHPQNAIKIQQAFDRLVSPLQMGNLFKFHIIW